MGEIGRPVKALTGNNSIKQMLEGFIKMFSSVKSTFRNSTQITLFVLLVSSFCTSSYAGYLDLGIHFGGATVDRIQLAGGAGGTDIGTGDVLSGSIGELFKPTERFDIQIGVGTRRNTAIGEEGNVKWRSEFLESSAHYNFSEFRLGGGLQYYINPKLRGGTIDRDFDNSTGYFISGELKLLQAIYAGLRLTHEEYQDSATKENVSGNTIGITLILTY